MIKKGESVTHRNGSTGIAIGDEKDGNVMVNVKGSTQNWSIYDITDPVREEAADDEV